MDAEELSILRFDNKKKISFEAAFLPPLTNTYEENSSDSDSSDSSGPIAMEFVLNLTAKA